MKFQLYVMIISLNFGCSGQSDNSNASNGNVYKNKVDTLPIATANIRRIQNLTQLSVVDNAETYEMTKRKIEIQRSQIKANDIKIDSVRKLFTTSLLHNIIPFWEGTKWSFEGHTSEPQTATIACGYFVSTTLQDIGLNLNRYKFAQQSPIDEANILALNSEVKEFSEESPANNILKIKNYLKEGIHFIGFDENHVGYILKDQDDLYLIHSNYIDGVGVEIEEIEQSEVFQSYFKFYIVELSTNERLLHYWINDKKLDIILK